LKAEPPGWDKHVHPVWVPLDSAQYHRPPPSEPAPELDDPDEPPELLELLDPDELPAPDDPPSLEEPPSPAPDGPPVGPLEHATVEATPATRQRRFRIAPGSYRDDAAREIVGVAARARDPERDASFPSKHAESAS
jgi:hypothetical protein